MFDKIAPYYDYFKLHRDYQAEAEQLRTLIHLHNSSAKHIVELGCGTGSLLAQFLSHDFTVAGVDVSNGMLDVAAKKLPAGTELRASSFDAFRLTQPADAVVWVDGAIGYVPPADIPRTLSHIVTQSFDQNGVLVIEPWYTSDTWKAGHNHLITHSAKTGEVYTRLSHGNQDGSMDFHHLIATSEGVEHIASHSQLWLHDYEKVASHLGSMGLQTSFIEALPNFKRGLLVATQT